MAVVDSLYHHYVGHCPLSERFDIRDVSMVGSTPIFRSLIIIILTDFCETYLRLLDMSDIIFTLKLEQTVDCSYASDIYLTQHLMVYRILCDCMKSFGARRHANEIA